MRGKGLRALLCITQEGGKERGKKAEGDPHPPCFLQEYDSMGVRGWGCAKNVILKGISDRDGV
jgi:hypothetical protein